MPDVDPRGGDAHRIHSGHMLGGRAESGHNALVMVIGVGVGLGEPDHLLAVNALPVDDGGHLAVTAPRVKADAASLQMTADGLGDAFLLRHLVHPQDFKGMFKDVAHVVEVKVPGTAGGVTLLHFVTNPLVSRQIDPEPTLHPQEGLDDTFDVVGIGGEHLLGAVDAGGVDRHLPPGTLHRHMEGLTCGFQKAAVKDTQGQKFRVQRGEMLHMYLYIQMLHGKFPPL